MARTNIDIVVTVRDGASAPLTNVQNKLKGTGKAVKDTSADFIQFNKTLFTTAAFLGAFSQAFGRIKQSVEFGAELDKVTTQFERTMGPRGAFIQALQQSSNIVVDETTAMQSALHLGMLGIVKDSSQAGTLISKFGVAAAMAGKDATKGVTDLTEAVEDGNIAKLQEYGIIKKNDAALMAQFAALNKAGGIYGTVMVKQMQLALVTKVLTKHTKDHMFMMLSTGQVVEAFGVQFQNAKRHIGVFLATAIRPLLEKMIPLLHRFKEFLFNAYKTNKEIVFLGKTVLAFGTILTGFIATLGTLKLAVKLLGFAGVGLPGLLMATVALAAGFVGLTGKADTLVKKLEVLGAFFKGIYELVTNFDPETGMSKISAATEKMLADNGILGFVDMIAAVIVTVKTTVKDLIDFVTWSANKIDDLVASIFGTVNDGIKDSKKWTTWWTSDALSNFDKVKRAALILGGIMGTIFLGKAIFGGVSTLLGKIGLGSGGKGPKGTPTDPIWVINSGSIGAGLLKIPGVGSLKDLFGLLKQGFQLGGLKQLIKDIPSALALVFPRLAAVLTPVIGMLATSLTTAFTAGAAVLSFAIANAMAIAGVALAAYVGYQLGTYLNKFIPESFSDPTRDRKKETFLEGKFNNFLEEMMGIDSKKKAADEAALEHFNNTSKEDLVKEFRAKQGGPKATGNALSNISTASSSDLDIVQSVGEQMKAMKQASRDEMQSSVEKALMSADANGRFISPEELDGFKRVFSESLAGDENLKAMGEKAKQTPMRSPLSSRQ